MTPHQYLVRVLERQSMTDRDLRHLESLRNQIRSNLEPINWYNPRFFNGGSYAKKTMIRESFDLDLVICFPHTDRRSLRDMYISVHESLLDVGYKITPKQVALTLQLPNNPFPSGHFHVDVVVGKAQDDNFYYMDIYDIPNNTHRRTSLKMHIDNVREIRDVIKLMKLWIRRHPLQWKTFAMEHTVIRALENQETSDLGLCMETVLLYIKSNIRNRLSLTDPTNSNIPINMSDQERWQIKQAADRSFNALQSDDWESIVW